MLQVYSVCVRVCMAIKNVGEFSMSSRQFEEALKVKDCWQLQEVGSIFPEIVVRLGRESLHCAAEKEVKLVLDTLWGSHNLVRRYRSALYLRGE